jgi:hypothetical protein
MIKTILMWFTVVIAEKDEGNYVYLLKSVNWASQTPFMVAYSSPLPLALNASKSVLARFKGECYKGWGIDEATTLRTNQWVNFRQYICTAESLEIFEVLK